MAETPTVLVVDDLPSSRRLLASLLAAQGYAVIGAASGEEALEQVRSVRPDLVLLDVLMPDLSGYEVCKRIRSDPQTALLPVVMVTALDQSSERVKGVDAGADDFLTKPINRTELIARVRSLLRIKGLHDTVQARTEELAQLNRNLEQRVQEQVAELQRLAQLKRFLPAHLAELVASGDMIDPLRTHRREVTLLVAELRGFNALADGSEPEETMAVLRAYHSAIGSAIEDEGGTLEHLTGSVSTVVFNDPLVQEAPALRAVRTALDMQRRFTELSQACRKRGHAVALGIGIAHGYATIGAIGYTGRIAYGVIGRIGNLAMRLSQQAEDDGVLVSAPVYELVEGQVEARKAQGVDLQGFLREMPAYRIRSLRAAAESPPRPLWRVSIRTLGQFSVHVDGEPLALRRKVQKKPLDLLKALIALGGTRVDIITVINLLWPDADGDAAKASFDSALHRLRKLLGVEDVLHLQEGRLSLDRQNCWVDVWKLGDLLDRVDAARGLDAAALAALTREMLQLCDGHFLEQESQEPWVIAARDRYKAKTLRAITLLGSRHEAAGEWKQVVALYSRSLELDNLAEGLYRRLMIAYREHGERAEALNVYRRCRDMLSIVLNARPSEETEAARATLD